MAAASALPTGPAWLFVPGDRPERFDKALAAGASAVILDLEDAVAPPAKARAREAVAAWLHPGRPVLLRLNAAGTPDFEADLALAGLPGVAGVMLPKAESPQALALVRRAGAPLLLPLVESAAGIAALDALARAPGVARLAFGSLDLRVDLGMDGATEDDLLHHRSRLVLASRLAGLAAPLDGVTAAVHDDALLATDVARARRLGFGGKLLIHPRQVAPTRAGFAPTAAELAWAQRVLAAAQAAHGAAVQVDGAMVDRPVLLRAQALVGRAGG